MATSVITPAWLSVLQNSRGKHIPQANLPKNRNAGRKYLAVLNQG